MLHFYEGSTLAVIDLLYFECSFFFNRNAEDGRKDSSPSPEKHDARSVAESTLSSATIVSDLNSSEMAAPGQADNLINLNPEPPLTPNVDSPPPSPYILRNKKISMGSGDSVYDEPYSNLEEIDAGITPVSNVSPLLPETFEFPVYGAADPEEQQKNQDVTPTAANTVFFPNELYGVMDKPEDEAVVMEVKDIEAESTIQDFDDVLNSLLPNEPLSEPNENSSSFVRSDGIDSTVLMF